MISISLDNPYLLFLAIPLALVVFIPYFIAIRKENSSFSTVASLIIHIFLVGLVVTAFAGLHETTVKTETEVIVVADVSYSTDRELDLVDQHIKNLQKEGNLPQNSRLGVVCFGKAGCQTRADNLHTVKAQDSINYCIVAIVAA